MKILQVNKFFYLRGGSERYYFNLCRLLENKSHQVIHFSMKDEKNRPSDYSSCFVNNLNLEAPSLRQVFQIPRTIYSFEARRKIERLIKDTKPDIAHLHNIDRHLTPSIIPALKRYKIPVVMTLHDYKLICPNSTLFTHGRVCEHCKKGRFYFSPLKQCIKDSLAVSLTGCLEAYIHRLLRVYNGVDLFLAPSNFLRQKFIEFGFPSEKIVHLPLFLPSVRVQPSQGSQGLVLKVHGYFLYFGRLSPEKGVDVLVKAAADYPGIEFKVAGRGPYEAELKNLAEKLNIRNIKFLGYKGGEELGDLIKGARGVILPSIWYENQPFSVMEAMGYGKMVIASNIGGIPELIEEGRIGFLFEPGKTDDLKEKIQKVLKVSQEAAETMGEWAARKITQEFDEETHYNHLINLYGRLL